MATVIKRGGTYHIQWYDRYTKKTNSRTTGLKASNSNYPKAKQFAVKLQEKIKQDYDVLVKLGIKPISLRDAFEHFIKNNEHKNPKTIKDYIRFYKKFTEYFDENSSCSAITKLEVENWLNEIKTLNFSQNTIHGYGKQCYHFLNFLFDYNYTNMFKINREVKTKPEIKEKIIFKDEHLKIIFKNFDNKSLNFKLLIYLLFYTGLRPSDLLTITTERVDIIHNELNYYSPKIKKYRTIPFHLDLNDILTERIQEVKTGKLLDYSNVETLARAIKRYMKKIELDGLGYSARTFRKTFITHCRNRYSIDSSIVRELVGHEHGNTTDRYYNEVDHSKIRQELKKFKGVKAHM